LQHIVAISAGWDHCMALEEYEEYDALEGEFNPGYPGPDPNHKGRVYTWGNNGPGYGGGPAPWGQPWERSVGGRLGNGTIGDSNSASTPVLVLAGEQEPNDPNAYLEGIIAVSGGEGHSMALDVNGFVYCWGDNQYG
jgi:alpha-tubulin suppressor-like RCC1 family protein